MPDDSGSVVSLDPGQDPLEQIINGLALLIIAKLLAEPFMFSEQPELFGEREQEKRVRDQRMFHHLIDEWFGQRFVK
ncbi:hypothetical protein BBH56_03500 [Spiribacter roseus]|nr:hypothetical protein BBH56_03500 [Spiribacter roseus]